MTMASFTIKPSSISCLVLMFLLFASSSSYASNKVVDVSTICKETENPSFCLNILNSKPGGAKGADLVTLAQYTIDVVRGNVTNSISLIKSLIEQSGKDPKAKAHYEECLVHFSEEEGALGDINQTQELLKKGDYVGVNSAASAVTTDVQDCISGEDPDDPTYPDKSKLLEYADIIEQVVSIILVISNYLR
ncbi:hypothetical protein RIF29_05826 [Crotalaria pallida]|uniref:Pectinesterase inhibitor domain-containing protein n=1 Tax=Crotalaria pallida TaxID=3830 RepID=A0AAN9J2H2_CROPI